MGTQVLPIAYALVVVRVKIAVDALWGSPRSPTAMNGMHAGFNAQQCPRLYML